MLTALVSGYECAHGKDSQKAYKTLSISDTSSSTNGPIGNLLMDAIEMAYADRFSIDKNIAVEWRQTMS